MRKDFEMTLPRLVDYLSQSARNAPWSKIPWDEPGFSQRMLAEHLSQAHDWASRNDAVITSQVSLIHSMLPEHSHILDLGCGPGLYTKKLSALGHVCTGVDISPASIMHAREQDEKNEVDYVQADILSYRPARAYDAVLMLFGEINAFPADEAKRLLNGVAGWLKDDGQLFLEIHTYDAVQKTGTEGPTWHASEYGLFSEKPYLCLEEHFWNEKKEVATTSYHVIDPRTCHCRQYASSLTAWDAAGYASLFEGAGFTRAEQVHDWPTGKDFEGRLQCFACQVNSEKSDEKRKAR